VPAAGVRLGVQAPLACGARYWSECEGLSASDWSGWGPQPPASRQGTVLVPENWLLGGRRARSSAPAAEAGLQCLMSGGRAPVSSPVLLHVGCARNSSAKLHAGLAGKQNALGPGQGVRRVAVCAGSPKGLLQADCVRDKCRSALCLLPSIGLDQVAGRGAPEAGSRARIPAGVPGRQRGRAGTQGICEVCACESGECW